MPTYIPERAPRRHFDKRTRMWRAMRQLRLFDAAKIAVCTENEPGLARRFIAALRRAGYIAPAETGRPYRLRVRKFRLVRNSGPNVPMYLSDGDTLVGMLDRNDGEVYGLDGLPPPGVTERTLSKAGLRKQRLKAPKAGAR